MHIIIFWYVKGSVACTYVTVKKGSVEQKGLWAYWVPGLGQGVGIATCAHMAKITTYTPQPVSKRDLPWTPHPVHSLKGATFSLTQPSCAYTQRHTFVIDEWAC